MWFEIYSSASWRIEIWNLKFLVLQTRRAGHLPKVTPSLFAEFLKPLSLARLGLLDLPTCVGSWYGFCKFWLRHFSRKIKSADWAKRGSFHHGSTLINQRVFQPVLPCRLNDSNINRCASFICLRYALANNELTKVQEYQPVVHRLPRLQGGLSLGPTNPLTTNVAGETLGFRRPGFSPGYVLLMPAFSLLAAPTNLTIYLHCSQNAPLLPRPLDEKFQK